MIKAAQLSLITCVGSLMVLSIVMLFSSSMQKGADYLTMQAVWGGLGALACIAAAFIPYRFLKHPAWVLFVLACIGLILVFVPGLGVHKNGSSRWIDLRVANFQPSEAAKLALIVILAWYGEWNFKQRRTYLRGIIVPGIIIAPLLVLIFIEPDRGTTILLAIVAGAMLLLAGAKWWQLGLSAAPAAAYVVYSLLTDPIRFKRIIVWLYPELYKNDVGYQAWQSMIALGSGGVLGVGLGSGRQKLGFVPEHQTDFILSVIGEELGLIATLGIVLAFIVFTIAGMIIAARARDQFGFLLASGITLLIGLQAFINIGVVSNALPNKGLPLPFVSYGGSSLLLMLIGVGILLSISRHSAGPAEEEELQGGYLPSYQPA